MDRNTRSVPENARGEERMTQNAILSVERGPNYSVVLKAKFHDRSDLVMPMNGVEAELLGRSLLLAGAFAYAGDAADGTEITNGHLPVHSFFIDPESGRHNPVLLFELPGGAKLTFQLSAKMAEECGEVLYMAGL
jgi:hypothetical protein